MERQITPPPIDRKLIDYLKQVYRDRLPELTISDRELGAKIGEQNVIKHLDGLLRQQEDDQINDVLQQAKD